MPDPDITKKPEINGKDAVHAVVKAGLSAIPVVGGPASELFSLVITPSLEKRRDRWIESIGEALKALEARVEGFKIENLKDNEAFVSTLMQASQAAIVNHQKEKVEALRNAVLNAALPNAPEQNLQHIFFRIVDSFTPSHLNVLKRLDKVTMVPDALAMTKGTFEEWKDQPEFCRQIAKDLHSYGLTDLVSPWEGSASRPRPPFDRVQNVTDLGKKFLAFIASPLAAGPS